ncbi:hypothetical protein WSPTPLR_01610 [Wolbachia pipientis]
MTGEGSTGMTGEGSTGMTGEGSTGMTGEGSTGIGMEKAICVMPMSDRKFCKKSLIAKI